MRDEFGEVLRPSNRQFPNEVFQNGPEKRGSNNTTQYLWEKWCIWSSQILRGHRPSGHKDNRLSQPSLQNSAGERHRSFRKNLSIVMNIQVYYVHEII